MSNCLTQLIKRLKFNMAGHEERGHMFKSLLYCNKVFNYKIKKIQKNIFLNKNDHTKCLIIK